ncbi:hypothetical protein SCNU_12622 [Gordonia neofelifaecis NRRL B-59395]|uniref:p-aminobenzoate N-oxygenase AurF n=1 Tax=Gordonia neofelifaecis NRRL B-59395 TaxID=644548 RepID=F1YKT9_9ACTN|nr:hypothetical protein SCNU_12622 [Gordonia neofelifaecis NRRL B-59395]
MTSTQPRPTTYTPPAKQDSATDYTQVLEDLASASVRRNFDPYIDIDWDAPHMAVVPNDPRWILSYKVDPIGRHPWYQSLPREKQIKIGMWRQANVAKVGLQFESILIRGLMQYADRLPNGDKRFRYTTHEAKEECNHTLMFQELVNRIGMETKGMRWWLRRTSPIIPLFSTFWPTIFFFGVLAGEEPIDHIQKDFLRAREELHPAMSAVMELHVAEEARHISFAHNHLRATIPAKGRLTKFALSIAMPIVMRVLCSAIVVGRLLSDRWSTNWSVARRRSHLERHEGHLLGFGAVAGLPVRRLRRRPHARRTVRSDESRVTPGVAGHGHRRPVVALPQRTHLQRELKTDNSAPRHHPGLLRRRLVRLRMPGQLHSSHS